MFQDPAFWVAVSFVILIAAAGRQVYRGITGGLDKRAVEIRRQLDEAEELRVEAQKMLAEYKRKQRDAEQEAQEMLDHARVESQRLREKVEQDLAAALKRREELAVEKIAQAEAAAIKEVRTQAIGLAMAATAKVLTDKLDKKTASDLVQSTIDELGKKLH